MGFYEIKGDYYLLKAELQLVTYFNINHESPFFVYEVSFKFPFY